MGLGHSYSLNRSLHVQKTSVVTEQQVAVPKLQSGSTPGVHACPDNNATASSGAGHLMIAALLVVVEVVVVVVSVEASCLQGPMPLPLLFPPFSQSGFSCLSSTGEASSSTTLRPRR